jgi:HAD superfamily hydrolase (TIGR01549 family)
MAPKPLRSVIFDWDGTLADTAEATYRAYVRMFAELDIHFDRAEYERTYSPNWHQTFRALGLAENRWNDADVRWLAHFASEPCALHTDAVQVLDLLRNRGIACAIVTSGSRHRISAELAAHGIEDRFSHLVFGDDARHRKPHPEALELCIGRLGVNPTETAYVGDSPEDIMMARAARVFSVAVPGGYPNRPALEAAAPDLFAETLGGAISRLLEDHA